MDNLLRLILRFVLVPLGYFAASIAGTLVVLMASWQLVDRAVDVPDDPVFALLGFAIGGPILLVMVLTFMMLPASIGILISEAFAIRSWIFHVLNGVASAWVGWRLYGRRIVADSAAFEQLPFDQPLVVVAAGIAAGFAYWAVAGFSAGFYKPVFRDAPPEMSTSSRSWRSE
jgi:hypothetical protein